MRTISLELPLSTKICTINKLMTSMIFHLTQKRIKITHLYIISPLGASSLYIQSGTSLSRRSICPSTSPAKKIRSSKYQTFEKQSKGVLSIKTSGHTFFKNIKTIYNYLINKLLFCDWEAVDRLEYRVNQSNHVKQRRRYILAH